MALAVEAAPGIHLRQPEAVERIDADNAVAGFVGVSQRGPIDVPQPLRSFGEYLQVFGGFVPWGHLAECAYAFFQNGGEKCWCVRVADRSLDPPAGPCPPPAPLRAATFATLPDVDGAGTLSITALDEGSWGNGIEFELTSSSGRDMSLTTLRAAASGADTVLSLESVRDVIVGDTIQVGAAGAPFVVGRYEVTAVDRVARTVTIGTVGGVGATFPVGSEVKGRGFRLRVRYGDDIEVFDRLSMTPEHRRYAPAVVNGLEPDLDYVERRRRGQSILVRIQHLAAGAKPASTPPLDSPPPGGPHRLAGGGDGFSAASVTFPPAVGPDVVRFFAALDRGTAAHDLSVTLEPFGTRTARPVPRVPLGPLDEVDVEDADALFVGDDLTLTFTAPNGTTTTAVRQVATILAPNRVRVAADYPASFPVGASATVAGRFDVLVFRGTDTEPVERHRNLSGDPAHPRAYPLVIGADSTLLCTSAPGAPLSPQPATRPLSGGVDPGMIDYRLYTGYEPSGAPSPGPRGLATLERVGEVGLVAIPDLHRASGGPFQRAQTDLLLHCQRGGTRFALLDPPDPASFDPADDGALIDAIETWPLAFNGADTAKDAALYFPRVRGSFEGAVRLVAPCGYVAGHIADSDRRRGVGKAPANARLKGVVDLVPPVGRDAQARLNARGVNCIRKFEDGDVSLFGARTLSADARWLFVNVRRVVLSVVRALSKSMLWAAFEPNDAVLRRRISSAVSAYLTTLLARGVTAGSSPAESFYVKCDEETNPTESVDAGRVIAEIGLAIAAPAEFVVLTVRKTPDALAVVEEDV